MTTSILIVDDQPELLEMLELTLHTAGYSVLRATDGQEALNILGTEPVDMIIADIAMPRLNGYQLYERVRTNAAWVMVPFMFLTARALDSDVRYGKELGADDYLVKPVQPEDLLAAVRGRLRRRQEMVMVGASVRQVNVAQRLTVGAVEIDTGQHRVWLAGQEVLVSAREFALLECLARQPNHVVPPQQLLRVTHGLETDAQEAGSLLRPLVRSLRRKLGYAVGEMGCIENVRGVGYRLSPSPVLPSEADDE
ncbi:MAG: response regulator [Chloroflexota bacterium]|jgi:DNA-binding response OmpR family regulator